MARFHYDCTLVTETLPRSDRNMTTDVNALLGTARTEYPEYVDLIEPPLPAVSGEYLPDQRVRIYQNSRLRGLERRQL